MPDIRVPDRGTSDAADLGYASTPQAEAGAARRGELKTDALDDALAEGREE